MSNRRHNIKVSLNNQELARLDELRGDDERAVRLRRLLHEPPDGSARRNQYTIHARFPIPDPIARGRTSVSCSRS